MTVIATPSATTVIAIVVSAETAAAIIAVSTALMALGIALVLPSKSTETAILSSVVAVHVAGISAETTLGLWRWEVGLRAAVVASVCS